MQVHACMGIMPEMLHAAMYILDSYTAKKTDLKPSDYQLAGFAVLVIPYKSEEVGPPKICFMTTFTDEYYGRPEVVQMERDILAMVRFSITQLLPVTLLCQIKMEIPFHQSKAPSNMLFVHVCSKDYTAKATTVKVSMKYSWVFTYKKTRSA